jgi:hypothetical protein
MSQEKYIGVDVHQATISVAVMDAQGKLIMECLLETKAATIVEFIILNVYHLHVQKLFRHRQKRLHLLRRGSRPYHHPEVLMRSIVKPPDCVDSRDGRGYGGAQLDPPRRGFSA